jgi:decaprenyl-phosphate phosphoribosyltransferase
VSAHLPASRTAPPPAAGPPPDLAVPPPEQAPPPTRAPTPAAPRARPPAGRLGVARRWLGAVIRTARPRQWPKNLLVLAAPLAGASLGRDDGLGYALVAVAAFTVASSAVYFVNDVADAERDRRHPVKCSRPVAAGTLPASQALAVAAVAICLAVGAGIWIGAPWLTVTISAYLALSFLYSVALKHVPGLELACVASGFVLRVLGGAAATHVPPSGWFLTVCSLGALMVAVAKRRGELVKLGAEAAWHRPVMRWYSYRVMSFLGRAVAAGIIGAYLLWAFTSGDGLRQAWHLVSVVPLAIALVRFDWLSVHRAGRPVEDLIIGDRIMAGAELGWLVTFALGL